MSARFSIARRLQDALDDTSASQIAEFAVALPLLLVMVVGIFDFGNAFNIKQKVTNTAREAARFGATQPTNDLSGVPPASILAIRDLVVQDLQNSKLSDCGLGSAAATAAGASTPWKWTFSVACGTAGNLVLSVDRGNVFVTNTTISGTPVKMIGTSVVLQYPYQWEFSRVIGLLVPGASYPGTSQISVNSFMANQT
jgi:Flp pilus assembly protein TadG